MALLDRYKRLKNPNNEDQDILKNYKPQMQTLTPKSNANNGQQGNVVVNNPNNMSISDYLLNEKAYNMGLVNSLKDGTLGNYLQVQQNLIDKNTATTNANAADTALRQYSGLEQARQQGLAEQAVAKEQGEKYLNTALKTSGLSDVGSSESSRIGIGNEYMRNVKNINQEAVSQQNDVLSAYKNAKAENEINADANKLSVLKEYQDVNANNLSLQIDSVNDISQIEGINNQIETSYKNGELAESEYNSLKTFLESKRYGLMQNTKSTNEAILNTRFDSLLATDYTIESVNMLEKQIEEMNKNGDISENAYGLYKETIAQMKNSLVDDVDDVDNVPNDVDNVPTDVGNISTSDYELVSTDNLGSSIAGYWSFTPSGYNKSLFFEPKETYESTSNLAKSLSLLTNNKQGIIYYKGNLYAVRDDGKVDLLEFNNNTTPAHRKVYDEFINDLKSKNNNRR